jgi:hypothetical protein
MAVYGFSEQHTESTLRRTQRLRLRFCLVSAAMLVVALWVLFSRPQWIYGPVGHAREWVFPVLSSVFAPLLFRNLRNWKSGPKELEASLSAQRVEISPERVSLSYLHASRPLERSEIQRAEEVPWTPVLYLRTSNRYRWIPIPKKLDGYENIKRELRGMGIPFARTSFPPNWEEFLGVLACSGTILCAMISRDAPVLTVNLVIAFLVSIGGLYVVNSNPDNFPDMRWKRFAVLFPLVAAVGSLLLL